MSKEEISKLLFKYETNAAPLLHASSTTSSFPPLCETATAVLS